MLKGHPYALLIPGGMHLSQSAHAELKPTAVVSIVPQGQGGLNQCGILTHIFFLYVDYSNVFFLYVDHYHLKRTLVKTFGAPDSLTSGP